jgi:hypothetical protein
VECTLDVRLGPAEPGREANQPAVERDDVVVEQATEILRLELELLVRRVR